jgi:hypothetical protein
LKQRVFDINPIHAILSPIILIGMCTSSILSIVVLQDIAEEFNETMWWVVNIWIASIIPISLYFGFFTKFNNPFRSKTTVEGKGN